MHVWICHKWIILRKLTSKMTRINKKRDNLKYNTCTYPFVWKSVFKIFYYRVILSTSINTGTYFINYNQYFGYTIVCIINKERMIDDFAHNGQRGNSFHIWSNSILGYTEVKMPKKYNFIEIMRANPSCTKWDRYTVSEFRGKSPNFG